MNTKRTTRSGSALGLALFLALLHAVLLPAEAEAQILDGPGQEATQPRQQVGELPAGMQTQAAQADGSRLSQQAAQEPLEDGRWVATYTSDAGVQTFSGPAYMIDASREGPRWPILAFCDDNPPGPEMSARATLRWPYSPPGQGEGTTTGVMMQMNLPGEPQRHTRDAEVTITSASEDMLIGSISAPFRYRADGAQQSALLEGQFRAGSASSEEWENLFRSHCGS